MSEHTDLVSTAPAPTATWEDRLSAVEKFLPLLSELAETAARAADKKTSLSEILITVASQLLGHDLRPVPPKV